MLLVQLLHILVKLGFQVLHLALLGLVESGALIGVLLGQLLHLMRVGRVTEHWENDERRRETEGERRKSEGDKYSKYKAISVNQTCMSSLLFVVLKQFLPLFTKIIKLVNTVAKLI